MASRFANNWNPSAEGQAQMRIVDSQVHIWAADTPTRPWPTPKRGDPNRALPFREEELIQAMNGAGVDRAVLVPPMWEGDRNDLCLDAARKYPDRLAVMGRLDPTAAESRGKLAGWRNQPGMLGLRFSFIAPMLRPLLIAGFMEWVWTEAERCCIPIYVLVKFSDLHLIGAVAEEHPQLKLIMDHLALPLDKKDEEAFCGLDHVLALAKHSNVAVKVSSLPNFSTHAYPYRNLHPFIRQVYDVFGPRRMFWGSDLTRLHGTYRECITMFTEEMPWLSKDDADWIMGRALCEWLDWKEVVSA